MRPTLATVAVAAVVVTAAGCTASTGTPVSDPNEPQQLDAEIVEFHSGGRTTHLGGSISDEPIEPLVAFGYQTGESREEGIHRRSAHRADDVTFVAVAANVGCQMPTEAQLWRNGNEVSVEWLGGEEYTDVTCIAPIEPYVQFAVAAEAVDGIDTIDDGSPMAASGPGQLLYSSVVPSAVADHPHPLTARAAQMGTAEADLLLAELADTGMEPVPDEVSAPPDDDTVRFAFVVWGCVVDPAMMVVTWTEIDAIPPAEDFEVDCVRPGAALAIFEMAADDVPSRAELVT